jgi:hypothetical protein
MPKFKKRTNRFKKNTANTRGDWEFSFFQKKIIENEEQTIKWGLRPENCFDPKNIPDYMNPQPSKEELIHKKSLEKEKLNSKELIILDNYLKKKDKDVINDMENIDKYGLNYNPITKEGRTRKLLDTLTALVKKNSVESICNIYLRLKEEDEFELTPDYTKKYNKQLDQMNLLVKGTDMIKLQFTKFHNNMPPLNNKSFRKFDPWQIDVINNIDKNMSTVISAPTSAGKTVLSGYAATKGKTLIVVPTDPLAWQMAAYIGTIIEVDVPIITQTYQSIPKRDAFIEKLNNSQVIVGTADSIVDYLPLININFDWIIFDEIHMIGKQEGSSMELIIKVFNKVPFLALSATIGNVDEIVQWFKKINTEREVTKIVCDKRFFNLQRFYYNPTTNALDMLHPLAMVDINEIKNGSILKKSLHPTPPDTWNLYEKLMNEYGDLGNLNHKTYFDNKERIHLSKATEYFSDLIKFMISNFDEEKIKKILDSYKNNNLNNDNMIDLVKLAFLMKENKKTPAIIFQKNTMACLRISRKFSKIIDYMEDQAHPRLRSERIKAHKKAQRMEKTLEKEKEKDKIKETNAKSTVSYSSSNKTVKVKVSRNKGESSRKEMRTFIEQESKETDEIDIDMSGLQEPHPDFILNDYQFFSEGIVEKWVDELKKFFPLSGTEYHFMIKLLWRGVGVYAKGLPDPYLRLVQTLANQRKLAIVFSDMSLVFGVSMPFKTVVIYRDSIVEDDLDSMLYHQMAGRAGRRGLDKEGNVIFAGFKWNRIEELSVCPIPNIVGTNTLNYVVPHANKLGEIYKNNQEWDNIFKNALNGDDENENNEMLESIKTNYQHGWNFAISDDKNHLHMMWKLRNNENEPIITSFLIPYLKKGFEGLDPNVEENQISIAHFMSQFINIKTTKDASLILPVPEIMNSPSFARIYTLLEELQLDLPKNVDSQVFTCIKVNKMIRRNLEREADELRNRLFEFGDKVKAVQHFCFHNKLTNLSRLLGKLLTRIWWIYHQSSPIMKKYFSFDDENEFNEVPIENLLLDNDSDNDEYSGNGESESDEDDDGEEANDEEGDTEESSDEEDTSTQQPIQSSMEV